MALPSQAPSFNISLAGIDNETLWQIYCTNPPPDSCPYGPCPNPDVTGIGQQVSLYITATVFAITLVHDTRNFRYAWYGYIANLFSFLVATALSIAKGKLTRPDAVFVILAVASPATIYLWALSAVQLTQRNVRPPFLSRMTRAECIILFILSLGLLLYWLGMIALLYWPVAANHIQFSQPACLDRDGDVSSSQDIFGLIWMLPFFTNWGTTIFALLLIVAWIRMPIAGIGQRGNSTVPKRNLFQWTFIAGRKVYDSRARHGYLLWKRPKFLLILMVMLNLLSYSMYQIPIYGIFVFMVETLSFVLTLLLFLHDTIRHRLRPGIVDIIFLLLFSVFFVTSTWLYPPTIRHTRRTPSCLLIVTHFIWFVNFWHYRHESVILRRRVLYNIPILLTFFGAVVFLTCAPFSEMWVPMGIDNGKVALVITLTPINIYGHQSSQIVWFMTWVLCAYQPSPRFLDNLTRIWYGIVNSYPVFKFSLLIFGPTMAWISSTHDQAPQRATEFSFGQIYAVITSIASVTSLIIALVNQREEFVAAFGLAGCVRSSGESDSVDGYNEEIIHPLNRLKRRPSPHRSNTW